MQKLPRVSSPLGAITRGTTNPNRLRRIDRWMVSQLELRLRSRPSALVVDLGYGSSGVTPAELRSRLAKVDARCRVLGLEIDPARVASAQPWAGPQLSFAVGGFEISTPGGEHPLAIRAYNVLRQYGETEVSAAWRRMYESLAPGGLLVEGTCDELGRRCCWLAFEKPEAAAGGAATHSIATDISVDLQPSTFTISVDVNDLAQPSDVAARLPKALIHRNTPGYQVHEFLLRLDAAWYEAAAWEGYGRRQRWIRMCHSLKEQGMQVVSGKARWRLGELTVAWSEVADRSMAEPAMSSREQAATTNDATGYNQGALIQSSGN
ncbi:class I SAM-dependent methyltransferase [Saxibacter everestensis]|uniref:Class I SAM-dependent methyltransferase n=1 Tax=Saxibacter everestensis TaxID=2909229 RepID=A0ABY8QUB7_9MICO|nr:class I SAM-dependent methyltransferase [Brevibacteriaceae bacterium ZFBP1038]